MTIIQSGNPIYFSTLQGKFGGTNPIYLGGEYYAGGAWVGSQVSYTNYSAGLSGDNAPNISQAYGATNYLGNFYGASASTIYDFSTTPRISGYSSSNTTTVSLSYMNAGYFANTGDTFLVTTQLHPSTTWQYSNTMNCTLAITAGTSSSIAVPFYHNKQWQLQISYDGNNTVTLGGQYGGGGSTTVPNGGAWLQGFVRTS